MAVFVKNWVRRRYGVRIWKWVWGNPDTAHASREYTWENGKSYEHTGRWKAA